MGLIIIGILIILFIVGCISEYLEKKYFNNGICPKCGHKLYYFDTDSHGGKGYTCNNCNYTTWVTWFDPEKIN